MSSQLIKINLSREDEKRKNIRPQQTKIANIIGIFISIILFLMAVFYLYVSFKTQEAKRLKSAYSKIEKKYIETQKLQKLYDKLSSKFTTLKKEKAKKINLADKWLELAKITPDDIYITKIEINPIDKNADKQEMKISARATGNVGESVVLLFLDRIKKNKSFTNTFDNISLSAVYSDRDEKVFSIILKQK